MNQAHARLSCSSSKRWITCSSSIKKSEGIPNITNDQASRGTCIHFLGEMLLKNIFTEKYLKNVIDTEIDVDMGNNVGWQKYLITSKMVDEAINYYEYVTSFINQKIKLFEAEPKVQLTHLSSNDEPIFGHCDAVIVDHLNTLHVFDLKTGMIPVNSYKNTQMMLYAYGLYYELEYFYDYGITNIVLHIVQNNDIAKDNTNSYSLTIKELLLFIKETKHIINNIQNNNVVCNPSPNVCDYCPANFRCDSFNNVIKQLIDKINLIKCNEKEMNMNTIANVVTDEELENIKNDLSWRKCLDRYFNKCNGIIRDKLLLGFQVEGYKLVRKSTRAKFKNIDYLEQELENISIPIDEYKPRKFITPSQLLAIIPKDQHEKISPYIEKPEGDIVLATIDDRRKPVTRKDLIDDFD